MNAIDRPGTAAASRRTSVRPHIYYLDVLQGRDTAGHSGIAAAVDLGFDTVLVPPPFLPLRGGDRFSPATVDTLHPALGDSSVADYVRGFVTECHRAGLRAMMDIPVAVMPGATQPATSPTPLMLDPRQPAAQPPPDGAGCGAWWADRIAAWVRDGLDGIRLVGLDRAPDAVGAIKHAHPALTVIAWTPMVDRALLPQLRGADFVVSSMPWWNGSDAWFWDELQALRSVAPVLHCPEAPFGPRLGSATHDPSQLCATLERGAALACALGSGWIMPAGYERGARRRMDPRGNSPPGPGATSIVETVRALNALTGSATWPEGSVQLLNVGGTMSVLRTDAADARFAATASLLALNTTLGRSLPVDATALLSAVDGSFGPFRRESDGTTLLPGQVLTLAPGELAVFTAKAVPRTDTAAALDVAAARHAAGGARVAIESPTPIVDDGHLPVKRLVGETVAVEADVICDGHDKLSAVLRWREPGADTWQEARMRALGNDRYTADIPLTRIGAFEYTIQAWRDVWATYRDEIAKKSTAGLNVSLELREGVAILEATTARATGTVANDIAAALAHAEAGDDAARLAQFLSEDLAALMQQADDRPRAASLPRPVRIDAERSGAAFAAWYEVFPRSLSDDMNRHGTFADVERHLPRVKAMGFDVLYFPPISPIGRVNRKGPNNTLTPADGDPGSPYAIGAAEGGHDAIHPELGTVEDFRHLVAAAADHGLEIAIDFAIQCSPDHPWLAQHRDWFDWRPDGSIKYAENPPKKYQDIVNVDFYAAGSVPDLWVALAEAVLWWMEKGVRLVRVDNPHTKPLPFWEWMIATVRQRYPDAVFLAEAFTRPKVMYRLAKVGFSQSYTYFTWRETKREMEQYLTELAEPGPRDFFRPHFFVNTPDINPVYLQNAPRSAYVIRAALAATLSGLWGVYNGFELCEGSPVPGKEEYLDSEKYQQRVWDWNRPGNIIAEITALNRIRNTNPALRTHLNATFLPAGNAAISVFVKATPDRSNVLVTAISFDPDQPQATEFEFPFWHWGATEAAQFEATDLLTGSITTWQGKAQYVRLTPDQPCTIWRIRALS